MIKVGIVGGTGYTGVELLRLLAVHPQVELTAITSRKEDGLPVADMFPSLRGRVMALLREAIGPVPVDAVAALWPDARQVGRCVEALVADGLVVPVTATGATAGPDDEPASYRLP